MAVTNSKRLVGKVIVCTASTDGIGLAIVERAASEGASVVISSRKKQNVDKIVADFHAKGFKDVLGVPCHVGQVDQIKNLIKQTIDKYGRIDGLVSNAAVSPAMGRLVDLTDEQWDKLFAINVKSAWQLIKEAAPYMKSGSSIIIVSSTGGFMPTFPISAYGVSKTALLGLVKAFASELGHKGIRVNGLAPGLIKTRFSSELYATPELEAQNSSRTNLGRLGESHEMAGVAAFLLSEDAGYVTGENIIASGGVPNRL